MPHRLLLSLFCFTVMATGWYYLFYSRAAQRLAPIEGEAANRQRVRLRRANGLVIMLLGAFLYIGLFGVSWENPTTAFGVVWLLVFGLLGTVILLALADVWLLHQFRRRRQEQRNTEKDER